jgi:hypothetical protein
MAGRRISEDRAEVSSVDVAFSRARVKRSGAASGSSTGAGRKRRSKPAPDIRTRRTIRLLMLRGLAPSEATNLTAFLCGIPVTDRHWELREINEMLFLRDLQRRGRFGPSDGAI